MFGLHEFTPLGRLHTVLGQAEILAALRAKGVKNADIGRVIGQPSSRITELFKGERKLGLAEAVKLVNEFDLEGQFATPSATVLHPLLRAMLRRSQQSRLTDASARVLAEALEYGLALVARNPAIRTNPDALAAVGEAAADRLPSTSPEE